MRSTAQHRKGQKAALICLAAAALRFHLGALAQPASKSEPLMLVTWFGPGAIALPQGDDWTSQMLTVYDNIQRPVAQFKKSSTGMTVSFIVFENHSGKPTAEGCREDAVNPILDHDARLISKRVDGEIKNTAGKALATTSYLLDLNLSDGHLQRNLFGFAGDAKTCAEIHISGVSESAAEQTAMNAVLAGFQPDLTYRPSAGDYFRMASILFKNSPGLAAPYYKSALDALPEGAAYLALRRVTTDQLVMSLGMSGDIKDSRAVAKMAIAADPDYPLNYYNLACADAKQDRVADAKLHLQLAFDRRANVLKGESMPDPGKDDSILKLKKDKTFWAFVMTLPRN
jgi:tetratricopeptide (TPR) repeat protein